MTTRKAPGVDIEKYRGIFFMTGLVLALSLVIGVFNIKVYDKPVNACYKGETVRVVSAEDVPVTYRQAVAPPPPVPVVEQIQVVDDALELDAELEIMDVETDEDEAIYMDGPIGEEGVKYVAYEDEESDEVLNFAVVESVPVFPGCETEVDNEGKKQCFQEKMLAFVAREFVYPAAAARMGLQGKIYVEFVIEKNGRASNIMVMRGVDPLLDQEAVRVITHLPKVDPARQRGKPVRMRFVMPISAKLAGV